MDGFAAPLSLAARAGVKETFGFTPGALALGGLIVAIGYVSHGLTSGFVLTRHVEIMLGGVAGAGAMGAYELFRRKRTLTLVLQPEGIGLFRQGKLIGVIHPSQVTWYKLSLLNTVKELWAFGFLALIAAPSPFLLHGIGRLWASAIAVSALSAFVSSIWIRTMCKHFIIPMGNDSETVVLAKSKLKELGVLQTG